MDAPGNENPAEGAALVRDADGSAEYVGAESGMGMPPLKSCPAASSSAATGSSSRLASSPLRNYRVFQSNNKQKQLRRFHTHRSARFPLGVAYPTRIAEARSTTLLRRPSRRSTPPFAAHETEGG